MVFICCACEICIYVHKLETWTIKVFAELAVVQASCATTVLLLPTPFQKSSVFVEVASVMFASSPAAKSTRASTITTRRRILLAELSTARCAVLFRFTCETKQNPFTISFLSVHDWDSTNTYRRWLPKVSEHTRKLLTNHVVRYIAFLHDGSLLPMQNSDFVLAVTFATSKTNQPQ